MNPGASKNQIEGSRISTQHVGLLGLAFLLWLGLLARSVLVLSWPKYFWLIDVFFFAVIPCVALSLACRFTKWPLRRVTAIEFPGRPLPNPPAGRLQVTVLTVIVLVLICMVLHVILSLRLGGWLNQLLPSLGKSMWQLVNESGVKIVALVYVSISAALVEEITYRGLTAHYFLDRAVPMRLSYVVVTTAFFAMGHCTRGLAGLVFAGLTGIAFAMAFVRVRDLTPLVVAHAAYDMFAFY